MNLRMLCVIAGLFLLSLCCLEPGVDAAGRTSGSIVATGPIHKSMIQERADFTQGRS
jgi:hypothetical protein